MKKVRILAILIAVISLCSCGIFGDEFPTAVDKKENNVEKLSMVDIDCSVATNNEVVRNIDELIAQDIVIDYLNYNMQEEFSYEVILLQENEVSETLWNSEYYLFGICTVSENDDSEFVSIMMEPAIVVYKDMGSMYALYPDGEMIPIEEDAVWGCASDGYLDDIL